MKNPILLITLLAFYYSASHAQTNKSLSEFNKKLNITTLGAIGDGVANNQSIIQSSINELSGKGGGVLYFPAGIWFAGDISLRNFVTLQFERGCTLRANISILDITNTGIIGAESDKLIIEGRVSFSNSQNIVLKNIFTRKGWGIHNCQGVEIDRVKIEQEMVRQPNGLAITCNGCKDVYVTNSELTCNDDAWCLKRSGENIHISKSILCGRQAASFKIGTESDGVFKNITVTDCIIYNSTRAGINIESVDGSIIQDVIISHVKMYDVAAPLYIQLGNRDRYNKGKGKIKNITISDVEYYGTRNDDGIGSSIIGLPDNPIENVTISRVHFNYKGGGTRIDAARAVPELPEFYPEFDIYGKLPAYGLYCRHVNGLTFDEVTVSFAEADLRPAIVCEDVQHLMIEHFEAKAYIAHNQYSPPFEESGTMILLNQVSDVSILHCQAPVFSSLVMLHGEQTRNISLLNNDISLCQVQPYQIGEEVKGNILVQPTTEIKYINQQTVDPVKVSEPFQVKFTDKNAGKFSCANVSTILDQTPTNSIWIDRDKDGILDKDEKSFNTFRTAIEQAIAGDVIMVLPGILSVGADQLPILVNKPRLVIRSASGAENTVIQVEGANQDMRKQHSLFLIKADGVTIDGLTMKAATYNICADSIRDCIIKNNIFDFSKGYHIYLVKSSGVKVQNNHGRASLYSFLQMENCRNCLIEENHIHGDPCGFMVDSSSSNLFRKNHFDGLAWYGITLKNSSDNIVEGNLFDSIRIEGLELRGASLRNLITGNTFRFQKNSAILLDGESRENKVQGNNITGNRGMGLTNETNYQVDAINNWWGATDGPSGENEGSGDPVDKNVLIIPWLTKPVK